MWRVTRLSLLLLCFFFVLGINNAFPELLRNGKVTFWSYDEDQNGIMREHYYIMNADGSDLIKLIDGAFQDEGKTFWVSGGGALSLSPDCRKTVFTILESRVDDAIPNVAILDIATHKMEILTKPKEKMNGVLKPRWSPDGKKIAFGESGNEKLYLMNPDGSSIEEIGQGYNPEWSPDGRQIAFVKGESKDIYIMDADGRNSHKIADGLVGEQSIRSLRWSPDGKMILINTHTNDRGGRIYIMNSNGDNLRLLRDKTAGSCWSPDGKKIAFVAIIGADDENDIWHGVHIWVMNPDGSELERLTNNHRCEYDIDWRNPAFIGVSQSLNASTSTWGMIKTQP